MCHAILASASFWSFLTDLEDDLAATVHPAGCPHCGGPLHVVGYPRKPRGALTALLAKYSERRNFCCGREGCRRRTTPPSVRFLGRKVYLGAVVVLVTAKRQGPTPFGLGRLEELLGVDRRTLELWREIWTEASRQTAFWRRVGVRFVGLVAKGLPLALLEAFGGRSTEQALSRLLGFLSPISTGSSVAIEVLDRCSAARRGRSSPS